MTLTKNNKDGQKRTISIKLNVLKLKLRHKVAMRVLTEALKAIDSRQALKLNISLFTSSQRRKKKS